MRIVPAAVFALFGGVLAALATDHAAARSIPYDGAPLTEADAGRSIALGSVRTVTVRLRHAGGGAYRWHWQPAPGVVADEAATVPPAPAGGPPIAGAPVTQQFRLRIAGARAVTARFALLGAGAGAGAAAVRTIGYRLLPG